MPDLWPNFGCPFFNEIALLAYEDASLLKQSLLLYLQKCRMYFSIQLLLLDVIALTLSWKPGETLFTFFAFFLSVFAIVNQAYQAFKVLIKPDY